MIEALIDWKNERFLKVSWPKNVIRAEISQCLFRAIPLVDQMPPVSPLSWPKNVIRAEISQYPFRVIPVVDQMPPVSPHRGPLHSSTDGKTDYQKVICSAFNRQMCRWAYAPANKYASFPLEVVGKEILLYRAVGQQVVAGNP